MRWSSGERFRLGGARWNRCLLLLAAFLALSFAGPGPASAQGAQAAAGPAGPGTAASVATGESEALRPAVAVSVAAGEGGAPAPAEEPRLYVVAYRFSGNTAFAAEVLAGQLAAYAGRELTLAQLEQAAAQVVRFYRRHGYFLAAAYVPPQEEVDGVVELAVVEGRWGQVVVDNAAGLRDAVVSALLDQVRPGALIQAAPLDRAVRLLGKPRAFRPGPRFGAASPSIMTRSWSSSKAAPIGWR